MSAPAPANTELKPVIIIGGGVAGLTAARSLKERGVAVLILEGRDRLGGRTHTADVAGRQIDMGAAWIDDHMTNRVYKMLNEAGVECKDFSMEMFGQQLFDPNTGEWDGRVCTAWTMGKMMWRSSALKKPSSEFPNLSARIHSILGSNPNREDLYMMQCFPEMGMGGSAENMHQNLQVEGAFGYIGYTETSAVMITGGYRGLVDLLGKSLSPSEVLLNQAVSQIFVEGSGTTPDSVRVETSDGKSYEGSHVIVTVPLGVLKAGTITFNPPLPAAKQDVIQRIGFGSVEKIVMTFDNAFWIQSGKVMKTFFYVPDPVEAYGMFVDVSSTSGTGPGAPSFPCLACICGTKMAQWTAENPEAAVKRVLEDLQAMFPDTFEAPIGATTSTWSSSPFSRGCYAFPTPSTQPDDFAKLAEPIHGGRVLFAGDAYAAGSYMGNVEGAMVSGERAAGVILDPCS